MNLYANWRDILKRAWSIRFMALAAVLSALEALLTLFPEVLPLDRAVLAGLVPLVIAAAFIARLVAQKDV